MSDDSGVVWLRRLGVTEGEEYADRLLQRTQQRSHDILRLCDALEGFYEHPNTTDEDREKLDAALERLFGHVVNDHVTEATRKSP